MTPLLLPLPGNETLAGALGDRLDAERGALVVRRFPDGESYVRVESDVTGRDVVLACTLDRPDSKLVPLLLVAATARDLGAARIGLVAPYLAYLRQDRRFAPGEGLTSVYVARVLSASIDWLVTVDPHLHRHHGLADVYAIPATALQSAPLLAAWIGANVRDPVLVGPDAESAQWAGGIARAASAPFLVLDKVRRGDRDVEIAVPDLARWAGRTPVLIDDILSTGHTIVAAVSALRARGMAAPVVVAVHAVYADGAGDALAAAGVARVVTTNTIAHASNAIDVSDLLAGGVRDMLGHHG